MNLYAYTNNNPISFSYNNSSAVGSTNVSGGLVSSIGAGNSFTGNVNSGSPSKGGLNLGWLANGLDTGSTIHGLYTSISGLVNHTAYFAKNLTPFADDMTMLGASMKDIISKRRKELGLTQQELADKLFVSDKVISKWETGKSVPDTSILVELANVLEISLDELLKSGKEVTEQNIKTAVADKVDVKYKNVLLITLLFIVICTVLFSVARILDYKDFPREYQVTVTIFYVLAILFIVSSLFYFLINRNKLIIDYPRFKEVDNNYIKKLLIIYGIATFIITLVIAICHRLEIFELLIVLVIASIIEAIFYLLIYLIYKKNHKN